MTISAQVGHWSERCCFLKYKPHIHERGASHAIPQTPVFFTGLLRASRQGVRYGLHPRLLRVQGPHRVGDRLCQLFMLPQQVPLELPDGCLAELEARQVELGPLWGDAAGPHVAGATLRADEYISYYSSPGSPGSRSPERIFFEQRSSSTKRRRRPVRGGHLNLSTPRRQRPRAWGPCPCAHVASLA